MKILLINKYFLEQIYRRDKYYNLLYSKETTKISQAKIGNVWDGYFLISNMCIIKSKLKTNMSLNFETPKSSKNSAYYRLTLLKKYNGKWSIENDIIASNKISIWDLFDKNKIIQKTEKYETAYDKLKVYSQ